MTRVLMILVMVLLVILAVVMYFQYVRVRRESIVYHVVIFAQRTHMLIHLTRYLVPCLHLQGSHLPYGA